MTKEIEPRGMGSRRMRPTLQNQVYERMRDALLVGRLQPGQKMTNRQLAVAMDVSVTPVREALQRLVAEHVLKMLPNGSVVVPILSEAEVQELREVTKALEGLVAQKGLPRVDNPFVERIRSHSRRLQAAYADDNWPGVIEANYNLHFKLYELASSPYLLTLIQQLWMRKGPHYTLFFRVHYTEHRGALLTDIISAVNDGRLDLAFEAFERLIDREFEAWIKLARENKQMAIIDDPIDSTIFQNRP